MYICLLSVIPLHTLPPVYDGHGGTQSAIYTEESLHNKLISQPAFKAANYKEALTKAFIDLDQEMYEGQWSNVGNVC